MMRADKRKAGEGHGILCAQARDAGRSDRHADGAGAFGRNGAAGRAVPAAGRPGACGLSGGAAPRFR